MKKLYLVFTNGFDVMVSDDGDVRRIFSNFTVRENDNGTITYWLPDTGEQIFNSFDEILQTVEDDSSWTITDTSIDDLTVDACILAQIETANL